MNTIRVVLAEDHTIVRKGLRALLTEAGIEVVGEAEDGLQAVEAAERLRPDVIIMDISMPRLSGWEATRQIRRRCPEVKVLALTVHASEEYVLQMMQAGASAYLRKNVAPRELVAALQALARGEEYLNSSVAGLVVEEHARPATEQEQAGDRHGSLTEREREVLQLIAEGHPNREIAELLHISVKTVESHRAHVLEKLALRSTAELVQYAIRRGIIPLHG